MNTYGINLKAYHEDHHDWILSIPAKKQVTCTCYRCKKKRRNLRDLKEKESLSAQKKILGISGFVGLHSSKTGQNNLSKSK